MYCEMSMDAYETMKMHNICQVVTNTSNIDEAMPTYTNG